MGAIIWCTQAKGGLKTLRSLVTPRVTRRTQERDKSSVSLNEVLIEQLMCLEKWPAPPAPSHTHTPTHLLTETLLHASRAVRCELAGVEVVKGFAVLVPSTLVVLWGVGDKSAVLAALTER